MVYKVVEPNDYTLHGKSGKRRFCFSSVFEQSRVYSCLSATDIVHKFSGVKVLGRCGSFEDPTDLVCEQWPWLNGPPAEQVLQRLSIKESISNQFPTTQFDPLEALMRIQSNNSNPQQEVA